MAVLDGVEVVYVARAGSKRILATNLHVGSRLPAYCTSMGKVLLAFLPDAVREKHLRNTQYAKFTPKTITNPTKLRRVLNEVRRRGYAVNDQELDLGLRSCSVPVFDKGGKAIAAINVSASSARASLEDVVDRFIPALRKVSQEITEILKTQS
jgi:IclR family pca regulon transcriptional regulator